MSADRWIFGYGSLVWRPGFEPLERAPAVLRDVARRFWQGSPDHRGVPEAPGRVATVVPEAGSACWGMGFRVSRRVYEGVVHALDARESGGFVRRDVELGFADPAREPVRALVYVAPAGNPNFLGPAPLDAMIAQVLAARGKSGPNADYVLRLAASLRAEGFEDEHVFALADGIAARLGRGGPR